MTANWTRVLPMVCAFGLALSFSAVWAEQSNGYQPRNQYRVELPPNMNNSVMELGKTFVRPGEPIMVYTNYASAGGQGKVQLVPAFVSHGNQAIADNETLEWHYAESSDENRPQMTLTFQAPDRPGNYELRLYNEGPEIKAIPIQVGYETQAGNYTGNYPGMRTMTPMVGGAMGGSPRNGSPIGGMINGGFNPAQTSYGPDSHVDNHMVPVSHVAPLPSYNASKDYVGQTSLRLDKNSFTPGETVYLRYTTDSRADSANSVVKLVPAITPHGSARVNDDHTQEWHFTQESQGILSFTAPDRPGSYELRFFLDDPEIMSTSFVVR